MNIEKKKKNRVQIESETRNSGLVWIIHSEL